MRLILFISFLTLLLLSSCQAEPKKSRSADLEKIAELKGQLSQLKMDNGQLLIKNSVLLREKLSVHCG